MSLELEVRSTTHSTPMTSFPDVARRNLTMRYVELPVVLRIFRIPRTACIVDLGCGRGFCTAALRDAGFHNVIGVDIDTDALRFGDHIRTAGDAKRLPVRSESVDVVFDFGTSYHVGDPARSLTEIQRILRPGGRHIYETRLSQLLSHPVRSRGKVLPWSAAPRLLLHRHALLWASRIKA